MTTKNIIIGVIAIIILSFGYYAISPLFRNTKVNEAIPGNEEMIKKDGVSENLGATVVGTIGHPASGTVKIISADGKNYVRYEDFKTINGPDIYVYLAKDLSAKDFINLGKVKATEGNINYEIPDGVNPADYPYVLTWCKAFGVLFNSAKLN